MTKRVRPFEGRVDPLVRFVAAWPGRPGGGIRAGERLWNRRRPGERHARIDPPRRQVRFPEVSRALLDARPVAVDRGRTVDDLEVAARAHLIEPVVAAARDQLRRD